MIIESRTIHDAKTCKTCKSEEHRSVSQLLHYGDEHGLKPVMISMIDPITGEITSYTFGDLDAEEIIQSLADSVEPCSYEDPLTAIKPGERGN